MGPNWLMIVIRNLAAYTGILVVLAVPMCYGMLLLAFTAVNDAVLLGAMLLLFFVMTVIRVGRMSAEMVVEGLISQVDAEEIKLFMAIPFLLVGLVWWYSIWKNWSHVVSFLGLP